MFFFWRKLRDWFQRRLWKDFQLRFADEQPDAIEPRELYLLGSDDCRWAAVFVCPCGCGELVWLNLIDGKDRPTWAVHHHLSGSFSIRPSIWRQVGCRSHFVIRKSRVSWAGREHSQRELPRRRHSNVG